ncbi:MAG: gamma-glutamyltransferase [Alphaproteobacteria bacterium]|nr:gamma-glutamyltransferase [Alphaproteobacteria bacterium]
MTTESAIETWQVRKPAVTGRRGLVASQHHLASDVGAQVLAEGGNAVDAAVAASLAIGTVEPWMSGLGGGGMMLVYEAAKDSVSCVDFGMVAPTGLDPDDYPLTGNTSGELFGWPAVLEDRNLHGYYAMAVPGYVDGIATALERFGTRSWADMLAPAIGLAEAGMMVDWYATLKIATAAEILNRFEESRRVYLPGGFPPVGEWGGPIPRTHLGVLPETLRRLAEAGPRDFYEGEIAAAIAADTRAGGSTLTADDLARYEARVVPALGRPYRGATVHAAPDLSAGPTMQRAFATLAERLSPGAAPDARTYLAYAGALTEAFAERLATMGDADEARQPSCTTHLSVIDAEGNMVALTQTLLSLFGSKVMLPRTGIMMNNGIMWFDPRPGRPNSIAAGKRPLSNMCPSIVVRDDGFRFAVGGSGGRRILPAVYQLISFLTDYGMEMEAAFHQPRIDVSGSDLVAVDRTLAPDVVSALAGAFNTAEVQHGVYPALFACPNAVGGFAGGEEQVGAAFVMSPWAKVSAA